MVIEMKITCGIFLFNKRGELLIVHPTFHAKNIWSIPKGTQDSNETPLQAAIREMFEEIGIHAPVYYLGKFRHNDPPEYQIVAVFLAVSDDTPVIDPSEFSDCSFRSLSEVDDLIHNETITPWLRDGWPFLTDHMKEIT